MCYAHAGCSRTAMAPGTLGCAVGGTRNFRRRGVRACSAAPGHASGARRLSPGVAGAGAPCRAPLSPQPVDTTALRHTLPGWHGFCPCLFSPPRWCSSGRAWQHTPPHALGAIGGATRPGRLPGRAIDGTQLQRSRGMTRGTPGAVRRYGAVPGLSRIGSGMPHEAHPGPQEEKG